MDAKHTENQEILELVHSPPFVSLLAPPINFGHRLSTDIWNDDERSILRDVAKASAMAVDSSEDDKNPTEDLKFRVKTECNIFSPDITHIQVTHPPRKSAEERASALLDRAFRPSLSPRMSRLSANYARRSRESDGFGRLSPTMFATEQFRLSTSPLPLEAYFDPHLPPPPNANFLTPMNPHHPAMLPHHMQMNFMQNPFPQAQFQHMQQQYGGNGHLSPWKYASPPGMPMPSAAEEKSPFEHRIVAKMGHRACARCHRVKKKCIRMRPGMPCISCNKKKLVCESRADGRTHNRGGGRKKRNVDGEEVSAMEEDMSTV